MELIEPYVYVRAITMGLAAIWAVQWALRMSRFTRRWKGRLMPLGVSERWLRNLFITTVLRATVLDPVNLALMLLLAGIWSRTLFV
jgi:hypothetical protein